MAVSDKRMEEILSKSLFRSMSDKKQIFRYYNPWQDIDVLCRLEQKKVVLESGRFNLKVETMNYDTNEAIVLKEYYAKVQELVNNQSLSVEHQKSPICELFENFDDTTVVYRIQKEIECENICSATTLITGAITKSPNTAKKKWVNRTSLNIAELEYLNSKYEYLLLQ